MLTFVSVQLPRYLTFMAFSASDSFFLKQTKNHRDIKFAVIRKLRKTELVMMMHWFSERSASLSCRSQWTPPYWSLILLSTMSAKWIHRSIVRRRLRSMPYSLLRVLAA